MNTHLMLVAVMASVGIASASNTCTLSVKGASFDLTALKKMGPMQVTGGDLPQTTAAEEIYDYTFTVCKNMDSSNMPSTCKTEGEDPAPAYQVGPHGQTPTCHVAGTFTNGLQLIDSADPTKGVMVNYAGGSQCHHTSQLQCCKDYPNECPTPTPAPSLPSCATRQTNIFFHCSPEEGTPQSALEVNANGEPSHCTYSINYNTMYACPQECGIINGKLCAGHGICGWDQSNEHAMCFCDSGWSGAVCSYEGEAGSSSGPSGTTVGLLVVLLLITMGLVGVVVFMARQVRAYRADAANYMQIRGQEMADQVSTI